MWYTEHMDLKQECEKTFYRELYHFEDEAQQLLMDETTKKLYLRKEKEIYDLQVYRYLKEHSCPQLANVHDFWEENGKLVVIEEYIEGETLESLLQKNGMLPEETARRFLKEICRALSFLHRATPQIVHRDLKASNVMLTKEGAVRLIDYDAAKTVKAGAGKDTVLIGTEGIAAPEQYGFAQSDGRTDIYALGVLMKRLFPDTKRYAKTIEKATRIDPDDRFDSIEELLHEIEIIKEEKPDRRKRMKRVVVFVCLLALSIVAGVAVWRYHQTQQAYDAMIENGEWVPFGSFRIIVPSEWDGDSDNRIFYAEHGSKMAFFSVTGSELDNEGIETIRGQEKVIIESFMNAVGDDNGDFSVRDITYLTIAGSEAVSFSYSGKMFQQRLSGRTYWLFDEKNNEVFQLNFVQADNCPNDYFPVFDRMIDSIIYSD